MNSSFLTHLQNVFIKQVLLDFAGDQRVGQIGKLNVHRRLLFAAVLHLLHHDSRAASSYLLEHRKWQHLGGSSHSPRSREMDRLTPRAHYSGSVKMLTVIPTGLETVQQRLDVLRTARRFVWCNQQDWCRAPPVPASCTYVKLASKLC